MESIGIGITTKNRPDVLALALEHFSFFWPENYKTSVFIYDDFSEKEHNNSLNKLIDKYKENLKITWKFGNKNLGIAGAKNECIKELRDCDHIFLFDDDCFPNKIGWQDLYIKTGLNHLMHLEERGSLRIVNDLDNILEYNSCAGTLLYLTKEAIDKVGLFDPRFDTYGYEHAQYTNRCHRAKVNGDLGMYLTPKHSQEYIYSIDLKMATHPGLNITETTNIRPELGNIPDNFCSTLSEEDKKPFIEKNSQIFSSISEIFIDI